MSCELTSVFMHDVITEIKQKITKKTFNIILTVNDNKRNLLADFCDFLK